MNRLFCLLLASVALFAQDAPAIEFTTTSNASVLGVSCVIGYQFTVNAPVTLTSLGAVLEGSSARPVHYFSASFTHSDGAAPVALAGDDQDVSVGDTVHLEGVKSFCGCGSAMAYSWTRPVPPRFPDSIPQPHRLSPTMMAFMWRGWSSVTDRGQHAIHGVDHSATAPTSW